MIRLCSGCKLNLGLKIGSLRQDGYHELETLFYPLQYPADEIRLHETDACEFSLDSGGAPITGENILLRAWRSFGQMTGKRIGLNINLRKRVPIGAGLGGGSANAAALLLWLNARAGLPLSAAKMVNLAASLGADVPFFLLNRPAFGSGLGEKLERVAFRGNGCDLVLVVPQRHLDTRAVFTLWDCVAQKPLTKAMRAARKSIPAYVDAGSLDLENDLEIPVFARWPELRAVKDQLLALGAQAAAMSGSGSAFYGIFADRQKARSAFEILRLKWPRVYHSQLMDFGMWPSG